MSAYIEISCDECREHVTLCPENQALLDRWSYLPGNRHLCNHCSKADLPDHLAQADEGAIMSKRIPEVLLPAVKTLRCCGNPEDVWALYLDYLQKIDQGERAIPKTSDPISSGRALLPAYLLDFLGWTEHGGFLRWTEHGGGVYGCWLTADGKEALAFLKKHGPEWMDNTEPHPWYEIDESGERVYY